MNVDVFFPSSSPSSLKIEASHFANTNQQRRLNQMKTIDFHHSNCQNDSIFVYIDGWITNAFTTGFFISYQIKHSQSICVLHQNISI
ncbi:hypothetical protein DERF_014585 [Dermatophagoides farinae]|uniref:Uncharacterized protein n=1 Tax=Dermatophagoides farinae TaxID=6954 RepID=A0A922L1F0_DERFA|nr:hypothetical protein DERF_014585 [Dermatophagoides farinae]